jgi:hypothetical protein
MGEPGQADWLAVRARGGAVQFFWMELKAPGKRPSQEQLAWISRQRYMLGLEAVWFDSLEKCMKWAEARFEE